MQVDKNKILLIKPSTAEKRLSFISVQPPINLAYLAAVLRRNDFDVSILDFTVTAYDENRFKESFVANPPALLGITCFTPTILNGYEIARVTKEVSPKTITVIGGPHSTALPEQTLKECPFVDAIVVGEGEDTFLELAERVRSNDSMRGCAGVVHRCDNEIVREPVRDLISSLDELPFPARDLLDWESYRTVQHTRGISEEYQPLTELFTSRGCPGKCLFCAVNLAYGSRVRFRSAQNVLAEVEECRRRYGVRHFVIQDDTFTLRPGRVAELMKGFRRLGVESFSCDARVDLVSEEMLREMANSGCVKISFGVESGSPRILAMNGKGITREQAVNAFKWGREAGIPLLEATFIVGSHPGETVEDLEATRELIREIRPDILFCSIVVPYPGTEMYRLLKEKGLYPEDENWEDFRMFAGAPRWRTVHFSGEELVRHRDRILRSYYFSPWYAVQRVRKLTSWTEMKYWLRAAMDYLRVTVGAGRSK